MTDEKQLYEELLTIDERCPKSGDISPVDVRIHEGLTRDETWSEKRRTEDGGEEVVSVRGTVWSDAIQAALDSNAAVKIPLLDTPIYLDRPIVLHSGNRLLVDSQTEIRLVPAAGVCLVRNENVVSGQYGPVELCRGADTDIVVEGGIWTDYRTAFVTDGDNPLPSESIHGLHGLFSFHNVESVRIGGLTIREGSDFGVQIGNCRDFVVEDLTFDEHHRDGVHLEGPAMGGIVRGLRGKTGDDVVALNAWDWESCSVTFGPISDVLVEDVTSVPKWTWSELRLLAGTKNFDNGESVACDITRCVFRNIRNIHTVKMYDQPNIGMPDKDFADPIGRLRDIFFSNLHISGMERDRYYCEKDAVFEVCADIDGMSVSGARLDFCPGIDDGRSVRLVAVGPMSTTWPLPAGDPRGEWLELFSPDIDCTVQDLSVSGVVAASPDRPDTAAPVDEAERLVMVRSQHPNPDFPETQPRGGTGRGQLTNLVVNGKQVNL